MAHWLAILLIAVQFISYAWPAQQKAAVVFSGAEAVVTFGKTIAFKVQIQSSEPVQKAFVYIDPQGSDPAFYPMNVSPEGLATFTLDPNNPPLRTFSHVSYHFQVTLLSGGQSASPATKFEYTDTRFTWKSLTNPKFQVFWYGERDVDFGQVALNTAETGLESAAKLIPAALLNPVRIYIYATTQELQGARLGSPVWVAGHASPDLGVIMVSIPAGPSQRLELERQLPHELTHILQYQVYGAATKDFPVWLIEGSAAVAEMNPNPDYADALASSVQDNTLIPLMQLCTVFPRDASGAFLSYAESQSFVRYLFKKYGASGLANLYGQYKNGLGCKEGVEAAYALPFSQIEYNWRQEELGVNPAARIVQKLLPYLIFLLVVLGAASAAILLSAHRRRRSTHE